MCGGLIALYEMPFQKHNTNLSVQTINYFKLWIIGV